MHLDVKPDNVVMGVPPRLIDLSVARTIARARRATGPIGTDAYMAPEQCDPAAAPGRLGPPADVFGLGATLYHALTGRRPFPRPSGARESADPAVRFPQLVRAPEPLGRRVPRPRWPRRHGGPGPRRPRTAPPRRARRARSSPWWRGCRSAAGSLRRGRYDRRPPAQPRSRRRPAADTAGSARRSRSRARPARPLTSSKPGTSARARILPTSVKSSAWRPRVASAGVPRRRPLVTIGGRGSNGTALRLTVMPIVVQPVLGQLAVELGVAQVDQHEVHVGAAGEDVDAVAGAEQLLGDRLRARHGAALALAERLGLRRSSATTALPAMTCSSGPPCWPGKTAESIFFGELLAADDHARRARRRASCGSVVVTTSAYGTGFGCRPAATRPAKCAMSTIR